jgi:hypothetical protein
MTARIGGWCDFVGFVFCRFLYFVGFCILWVFMFVGGCGFCACGFWLRLPSISLKVFLT